MVPERLAPLLAETEELLERFSAAGHTLYLVGGTVRDAIAGRPGGAPLDGDVDIDLTTDARPDAIEGLLAGWAETVWLQGKRFGTVGAYRLGRRFEITTHRAEAYVPDSRKPDVVFGNSIEADLSRRDFTVNAMALRLSDRQLIDPFDGLADLAQRRLRTPLSAKESFTDDPLRMLRGARFVAGYDLEPDPDVLAAIDELHTRLEIVSAERVRDELDKLIVLPDPTSGLWFVVRTGLAAEFVPELPALALEQDPVHRHKDVLAHTIAVVTRTAPDKVLRLAALFHDVGKPKTRAYGPGGVTFHHHDVVGARMTRQRMTALRYPTAEIEDVTRLVELHLRFHTYSLGWSDAALRRYARDAGPLLDRLNALTRADCTTRSERKLAELQTRMDDFEERLAALREREAIDAIRPELNGDEVMAELDLRPGRDVGEALAWLLELRFEEGLLGKEEAARRLREWWSAKSAS